MVVIQRGGIVTEAILLNNLLSPRKKDDLQWYLYVKKKHIAHLIQEWPNSKIMVFELRRA